MRPAAGGGSPVRGCRLLLAVAGGVTLVPLPADAAAAGSNPWAWSAGLSLRETWDSNVFLQDREPDYEKVPRAAEPFRESMVTSVTPRLGIDYREGPGFGASVWYAPEVVFYHRASSEDHVAHRGAVNLSGRLGEAPWQLANTFTAVQGSDEGLYFGAPGGAPAIGGIPIRDRRSQFVYRGKLSGTWTMGRWFVRPVTSAYWHDFWTVQKNPTDPVVPCDRYYENYIDRREWNIGADLGRAVGADARVFVGGRYGLEIQGRQPGSPYHYDSEYVRPLAGVEGRLAKWISVSFSIGPDIHHTLNEVDPRFDADYTTLWVDGVVTLTPATNDTVVLTWKANTQPAFASCSVYDDLTYDVTARHRFGPKWSASAGFRLYIGDWFAPVKRDDWIYTLSAGVAYRHDAHWGAELGYSYDWVDSQVPGTPGREFTRNLVWLGLRWTR